MGRRSHERGTAVVIQAGGVDEPDRRRWGAKLNREREEGTGTEVAHGVVTVLGDRVLGAGAIDAHGHTWIQPRTAGSPRLDDLEAIAAELAEFAAAGGAAVIDCQPRGCGRDIAAMRELSRRSGVSILAATGFHLARYYPPHSHVLEADEETLARLWLAELTDTAVDCVPPIVRTPAGIVKAAFTSEASDAGERRRLTAAATAAREAGVLLVVHTERGREVEALAEWLVEAGQRPEQVLLSHVDKRPDVALHAELAQAGFLLGYDTFLRPRYSPEEHVWPLLEEMLARGHVRSIACGLDLADFRQWRHGGGVGPVGLIEVVREGLVARGVSGADVDALTGGTVLRALPRRQVVS